MRNFIMSRFRSFISLFGILVSVTTTIASGYTLSPIGTAEKNRIESQDASKNVIARIQEKYGELPLFFIENKSQVDNVVKFYCPNDQLMSPTI